MNKNLSATVNVDNDCDFGIAGIDSDLDCDDSHIVTFFDEPISMAGGDIDVAVAVVFDQERDFVVASSHSYAYLR